MAEGCTVLDLCEAGAVVGAAAVEIAGNVATIKAAVCWGALTYDHLTAIEQWAKGQGVRGVGMFTRRPGLVRALRVRGYGLVEAELFKVI